MENFSGLSKENKVMVERISPELSNKELVGNTSFLVPKTPSFKRQNVGKVKMSDQGYGSSKTSHSASVHRRGIRERESLCRETSFALPSIKDRSESSVVSVGTQTNPVVVLSLDSLQDKDVQLLIDLIAKHKSKTKDCKREQTLRSLPAGNKDDSDLIDYDEDDEDVASIESEGYGAVPYERYANAPIVKEPTQNSIQPVRIAMLSHEDGIVTSRPKQATDAAFSSMQSLNGDLETRFYPVVNHPRLIEVKSENFIDSKSEASRRQVNELQFSSLSSFNKVAGLHSQPKPRLLKSPAVHNLKDLSSSSSSSDVSASTPPPKPRIRDKTPVALQKQQEAPMLHGEFHASLGRNRDQQQHDVRTTKQQSHKDEHRWKSAFQDGGVDTKRASDDADLCSTTTSDAGGVEPDSLDCVVSLPDCSRSDNANLVLDHSRLGVTHASIYQLNERKTNVVKFTADQRTNRREREDSFHDVIDRISSQDHESSEARITTASKDEIYVETPVKNVAAGKSGKSRFMFGTKREQQIAKKKRRSSRVVVARKSLVPVPNKTGRVSNQGQSNKRNNLLPAASKWKFFGMKKAKENSGINDKQPARGTNTPRGSTGRPSRIVNPPTTPLPIPSSISKHEALPLTSKSRFQQLQNFFSPKPRPPPAQAGTATPVNPPSKFGNQAWCAPLEKRRQLAQPGNFGYKTPQYTSKNNLFAKCVSGRESTLTNASSSSSSTNMRSQGRGSRMGEKAPDGRSIECTTKNSFLAQAGGGGGLAGSRSGVTGSSNTGIKTPSCETAKKPPIGHATKVSTQMSMSKPSIPKKAFTATKPAQPESYDISDIKSEDEEEEVSIILNDQKKRIPSWASGEKLKAALIKLQSQQVDVETVFGTIFAPNLNDMFDEKKPRFDKRTSSAMWEKPLAEAPPS